MAVAASTPEWITAIASVVTTLGVLLALLAYLDSRRASQAAHYFELMNHLQDKDAMSTRRALLDHWDATRQPISLDDQDRDLLDAAGLTASTFSTAGRVVAEGYVSVRAFLAEYGPLVVLMHEVLAVYLDERRDARNDPTYHESFTKLARWAEWWTARTREPASWTSRLDLRRPWSRVSALRIDLEAQPRAQR